MPRVESATTPASKPTCGHGHLVEFYETEAFLVDTVRDFLEPALREGDAALVVATLAHRREFETALGDAGIDVGAAVAEGRYLALDAAEVLSLFMVDGSPDPRLFRETIGTILQRASRDGRRVRVYGEMVALLCGDGDVPSALALEDLWNDLAGAHRFELLCAYSMGLFSTERSAAAFERICEQHTAVIPSEGYSLLADPVARSRAIAQMQQSVAAQAHGRATSDQNARILDAAGEGIFCVAADGSVAFANATATRIFGYAVHEMTGRRLHDVVHPWKPDGSPYPVEECPMFAAFMSGTVDRCNHHDVWWRKNGTSFPVEFTSTSSHAGGAVVVFRDITERREAESAQEQFISVVSHELRTPLTAIRVSLGLLQSGVLGTLPEHSRRMVEVAVQNTDRLVRMINDILDLERVDAGAMALRHTTCDAAELIARATEAVLPIAIEAGVRLSVDAPPATFRADADRLIQTLINLVANAVKFSPAGATVEVRSTRRDGDIHFDVADHGRGIPADKLELIFERFGQVHDSDGSQKRGTGLGLAICRSTVEQHGGRIWATSVPGTGSTFSFVVPTSADAGVPATPHADAYEPVACEPSDSGSATIDARRGGA